MDPLQQLNDSNTLNKYKTAGLIATRTVDEIIKNMKVGTKMTDLLTIGNDYAQKELNKVYKEIKNKGLCFPICLSPNNIAGHYIPSNTDIIKEEDIIKIELGIHIDDFPSTIVFTTIVTNSKVTDTKKTNVIKACIKASKNILPLMTPGNTNKDIVSVMEKYAEKYNCNLPICNEKGFIPGIFSYQMSKGICDGHTDDDEEFIHRFILSKDNPSYDFSMREMQLEENEVYSIDILMSSGVGKLNSINKVDIFKRNHSKRESLKLKLSRESLNSFNNELFPVSICNKETKVRLGLKECLERKLIDPYPVVAEKESEYVARIKFTVIVKDKPILICGRSADSELNKMK